MEKLYKKSPYNFKELLGVYIKKLKKTPWTLGKNAFLSILIFILIDMLIGGFLFYKYVLLIDVKEPDTTSASDKFDEKTYQSVLKEWEKRKNILIDLSALDKNYTDPFKQNSDVLE